MAFTEDIFFKTDEKYQHRIRILYWKDDKYVKSEDLFLPHEFYASDIVKEIQKPNIDLSIYPCVNEGAFKLPQYLFLDIDGCEDIKDLENFIYKVNNVLDASPFYILETSPNHFVIAYLILAMNEDLKDVPFPSHRIAQELLKPIMSPKLKLKLDKNSFSENFPMRLPLSYNHKREYQTRLITFEGIRTIPKPFDPSQFDIFELLEKNEGRTRGRKRTVKVDNEEELWQYVITEILNQKWEWRQAGKGQYLLLNCPFHPPDTRPSSQLIKYGDGKILFYDFHDGTSMSLPTFLNELARNTQDPIVKDELYKVYHSIYKKQKERNELISVSKSLLEEGEEPSQEDIFESLSDMVYEKLKEITKEVLIIYRDGEFTLHGKFVNINHKPYDECIITMNLEDFTKAEKFLHEYSITVIDTHFNVIAKLFNNKKLPFIKEFKKILQYGYSKYLDWLSEEFKLREQASMKQVKEEILQKLYAILSRSRDAKKYAFDSEAFIRFFNSFLKDKLKQFSLPYLVLNYDDGSVIMIPIEGLARVLDNYREVFYGLNLSDILSIILHPLPDEDSREPKIYKDFWLDMEWICISTSIIPQSYGHIISLDIKHKQEVDQEKFERFIECLKLNQFNESDYPPVLEALNIAYQPLNKNFFEMRINNKEHLIDLLTLALTSTFAIQIHDEPSEKFIASVLTFLGIPYDIQDNIIIARPDLDGGSGEAVLLYHIYDCGDTTPYITIDPHEEKDPDEIEI